MAYQSEIDKLTARWNENPEQYFAPLADAYRKAGDLDLALEVVRAGLQKRPNYLSAHIVLGRCLLDKKSDAEALKVFEHVLELDAENIIALRYLGEITERGGDVANAQRWVKRLLEVDPMNDDAVDALKRLEAAAQAAPVAAPATPPVAAKTEEVHAVSGFEATAIGTPSETAGPAPAPSDDLALEQSSSPFESTEATVESPGLELEPAELSFDSAPAEEQNAPGSTLELSREAMEAPESIEPSMLSLDETSPAQETTAEAAAVPGGESEAPQGASSWGPAQDLPLIMPEDVAPEPVRPPPAPTPRPSTQPPAPAPTPSVEGEPEPVITETMAEVYLKQGLTVEARDVYRKLVEQRPHDRALREKLAGLEQRVSPARESAPAGAPKRQRFAATDTGGVSARSFFGKVLSSRPGMPAEPAPATANSHADTPAAASAPAESAMDAAFAEEPAQGQGEPTRPTSDELSLAAVFGEEPAPAPGPAPQASPSPPPGFSFDEFFGGKRAAEGVPSAEAPTAEAESTTPDDFVSWLKGLKS